MMFLLFHLGGDRYVIEASRVLEVLPLVEIRRLPEAPRGVAGIFNYRGQPAPAVDLSELALGRAANECLSTRLIVVGCPDQNGHLRPLGLIAERATEIISRERAQFVEPGLNLGRAPYLGPVLMDGQGVIQWVHEGRLLTDRLREALFSETAAAIPAVLELPGPVT